MKNQYRNAVIESTGRIQALIKKHDPKFKPEFVLTLGSGLGGLADTIHRVCVIPYTEVNFPPLTVQGHKGEIVVGYIKAVPVIGFSGRKHYYEISDIVDGMKQVVFPVHVAASLGAKVYFGTNAVGGLHEGYRTGDLMVVRDHIDLFFPDALLGPHLDFGGNMEFQPQNTEYDLALRQRFLRAAKLEKEADHVHQGVYVARTGRTYETAATSRVLRGLGADAVGMSLIPEIITATNRGMKTLGVSIITNVIARDGTNATSHQEVMSILESDTTRHRLARVFTRFFSLSLMTQIAGEP